MRGFRDRDFIESTDGMIFCVIGNIHPTDRVVAYLKYVPYLSSSVRTKWSKNGVIYGRIIPYYSAMGVKNTMNYLKKHHPEYVVYDNYRSIELIEVPRSKIKTHFKPEERLQEILCSPNDELERLALELVEELSEETHISLSSFGITGSILLKMHNLKYSDVDLIVYGQRNGWIVREVLKELLHRERKTHISLPKGRVLEEWSRDIASHHPLSLEEAMTLYSKYKWNRAIYRGRPFSIHPVKLENEVSERWEDKIHRPLGLVKVKAKVTDASESIFMPAVYAVDDVKVLAGVPPPRPVTRIVSYEGLYMDLAEPGEEVIAYGKLEEVEDLRLGETYCQVTIGTFEAGGRDYIKPKKWLISLSSL
uniref:Polymerase nucleotidyl transferase domain-containing protein n=1 Tax=Thermofilum pendens TaxID=2269 RepID=A0A7C4FFG9_THEPE